MRPLLDRLVTAHAGTGALVHALAGAAWNAPTPCPDWDVAAVARHVVVGNRLFTGAISGDDTDLATIDAAVRALPLDALPAAYDDAAATLTSALSRPGALEASHPTRLGPLSGSLIGELRIVEALCHGWDLSVASGQSLVVADDLVEHAIVQARRIRGILPHGFRPFGTEQPAAAGAPALDRLAAQLGRALR